MWQPFTYPLDVKAEDGTELRAIAVGDQNNQAIAAFLCATDEGAIQVHTTDRLRVRWPESLVDATRGVDREPVGAGSSGGFRSGG